MSKFADDDKTVFVQRDKQGKIVGVYACFQEGLAEEEKLADDTEVTETLASWETQP